MIRIGLSPDMDMIVRDMYLSREVRNAVMFPLIADGNTYIDPGCGAVLMHKLEVKRTDSQLLLMADSAHLISSGIIVEVHRIYPDNGEIFTSVFNVGSTRRMIKRGDVYSCIQPLTDGELWQLVRL